MKIVHVLRAPVGGLFRHVMDLSREQIRRGHAVGVIADSLTGGAIAERSLADLEPHLSLGLSRLPMRRGPHPGDLAVLAKVALRCKGAGADVIHGHGSKGGVYGRLAGGPAGPSTPLRVYTPHGGSLNHAPGTFVHSLYMQAERFLGTRTDLLLFESGYIAERFAALVGPPRCLSKVVRNGIVAGEFVPVPPAPDAADFVYVGELRALKGIDTLLDALALIGRATGRAPSAVLVGAGGEREALEAHAARLGLGGRVSFAGSLPARQAFERGRILVVPSRAESLPYVVLEAVGARVPTIATNVGGIPEIFGPYAGRLLDHSDPRALANRMAAMLDTPETERGALAEDLARFVQSRFSIEGMVDGILAAYDEALSHRHSIERPAPAPSRPGAAPVGG